METADRPLEAFRARPDRDTLRALLKTHQSTVYNVCFQVLRREHDAEDAAQEALLEIARGVAGIREPRAFKRWLCRTALHTALDHLRKRQRRARHEEEARASMKPAPADGSVDAIHEALSRLDDPDRCLLVEKYFERATLEEIGAREGISTAAVGKRVDRAKEQLKQHLAQAGMSAVISRVDSTLEGARPAALIPDLISTSQAVESVLVLAEGAAMGTKAAFSLTTIAVALTFLTIGAGSGYLVGVNRTSISAVTLPPSAERPHQALESAGLIAEKPPVSKMDRADAAPDRDGNPGENPLLRRLNRFMKWRQQYDQEREVRTHEDVETRFRAIQDELKDVRDLILKNPAEFLDWLSRGSDPTAYVIELLQVGLGTKKGVYNYQTLGFGSLPPMLMDGLLSILQAAPDSARHAVLEFLGMVHGPTEPFRRQYVALLSDPNFTIQVLASKHLMWAPDPTPSELKAITRCLEQLPESQLDASLMQRVGRVSNPEVRDWMMQLLESDRVKDPYATYLSLEWWIEPGRVMDAAFQRRTASILSGSMQRTTGEDAYMMTVFTALNLPTAHSLPLIEQAAAGAPTERLRGAAQAVLQKARTDEAGPRALQDVWKAAYSAR